MMRVIEIIGVLAFLWGSAGIPVAMACSSCGSGSANPLYLYPYETTKVYFGTMIQTQIEDVTYNRQVATSVLLKRRLINTVAFGQRMTNRSFLSLRVNQLIQEGLSGDKVVVVGDPVLNYRYSIHQQSFIKPFIPQLEIFFGYKHSSARSSFGTRHSEMLDVGGTGFNDTRVGLDIWSGMTPVQFGASFSHSFAKEESTSTGRQHPGDTQNFNLSLGKTWKFLKLTGGVVAKRKFLRRFNSQLVARSESLKNNLFISTDWRLEKNSWRLTAVKQSAFGINRASSRSTDLAIAYLRSF